LPPAKSVVFADYLALLELPGHASLILSARVVETMAISASRQCAANP
jgi:hypothetical protein